MPWVSECNRGQKGEDTEKKVFELHGLERVRSSCVRSKRDGGFSVTIFSSTRLTLMGLSSHYGTGKCSAQRAIVSGMVVFWGARQSSPPAEGRLFLTQTRHPQQGSIWMPHSWRMAQCSSRLMRIRRYSIWPRSPSKPIGPVGGTFISSVSSSPLHSARATPSRTVTTRSFQSCAL